MYQQTELQSVQKTINLPTGNIKRSLAKAVFSLSAIAVCARLFGFAEKIVVAHFFGTTETADVYFAVMGIVFSIVFLVKELVYPSLLPVFTRTLNETGGASSSLFRKMFLYVTGVLVITAIALFAFGPSVIKSLLPGFSGSQRDTACYLLRVLLPGLICLGLMMVTYTTLNARKRFVVSAFGELGLRLFIIIGFITFLPIFGIHAIGPVIGVGALVCLLGHLYYLKEPEFILRPGHADSAHLGTVLVLMAPLVLGVVFSHIGGLIDNLLASQLPKGQLSCLGYAKRMIDTILVMGPAALVTVMYTHTSHLSSSNQLDKLARLLNKAVRILLFLSIPLTCLVIELRDPLLKCVFQHGRFDAGSVAGTSTVLMVYALGLITLSLEGLMVHSFFALRDTKTPTMIGIVCVVIRVILAIAFLTHFQYLAIAGALVVSKTIKLAVLGSLLRRRLKGLVDVHIVRFLLKTLFATFLLWCTLRLFSGFSAADSWGQTALLRLLLPAAAGVLSFVLSSYFLKIEELWTILSMTVLKNTRTDSWEQKHDG